MSCHKIGFPSWHNKELADYEFWENLFIARGKLSGGTIEISKDCASSMPDVHQAFKDRVIIK